MELTTAQRDRPCGLLLATAAGDALGAPYESQPARGPELEVAMVGGGAFGWEPGEWTDDTSMALAIGRGRRDRRGPASPARCDRATLARVGTNRQRRWRADPLSAQYSGTAWHLGGNDAAIIAPDMTISDQLVE